MSETSEVLRRAADGLRDEWGANGPTGGAWHRERGLHLAVADWLDQEAEAFDAHMARQTDPKRRFNTLWLELSRQRHEHALAVARAYLGADQ